ncbi:MAG: FG-GAP repeat domain-containing protein [Cyclobacteriaceae bacterium]
MPTLYSYIIRSTLGFFLLQGIVCESFAQAEEPPEKPVQFRQKNIAMESYEAVGAWDVDGDDTLDLVSGAFWYQGPDFKHRNHIAQVDRWSNGEYYNDFASIPMDINSDGRLDFITGSWGGRTMLWRENQAEKGNWVAHLIDSTGPVECMQAWDIDGDGQVEVVPNNPGNELKFYQLEGNKFVRYEVGPQQGHGLGFGDVNGDGRGDLISNEQWYEAPEDPFSGEWKMHQELSLGSASVPILVVDVNEDGRNDLIVGQGHHYGLAWYEQSIDESGQRSWITHPIDPYNSQFHTMAWEDITGDGQPELITGKRFRAHNGRDPGSDDPLGLYYFQWNGKSFTKHTISYGPLGEGKGAGLFLTVTDLNYDGRKDIAVGGKDGLSVFYNEGSQP